MRCNDCEAVFDEPGCIAVDGEVYYGVPELPGRHTIWINVCPECGSEDFEEYEEEEDDEE